MLHPALTLAAAAGLAAACSEEAQLRAPTDPPGPIAPARDGDVAIAEELELTRKAGTIAAYDLFIARHPSHPLAETARRERDRLSRERR